VAGGVAAITAAPSSGIFVVQELASKLPADTTRFVRLSRRAPHHLRDRPDEGKPARQLSPRRPACTRALVRPPR
jgi:hypothetical protein